MAATGPSPIVLRPASPRGSSCLRYRSYLSPNCSPSMAATSSDGSAGKAPTLAAKYADSKSYFLSSVDTGTRCSDRLLGGVGGDDGAVWQAAGTECGTVGTDVLRSCCSVGPAPAGAGDGVDRGEGDVVWTRLQLRDCVRCRAGHPQVDVLVL